MICDLAQYYRIYDYHTIPAHTLAVLVGGLDETSRVQKDMSGVKVTPDVLLLAGIFDDLNRLLWNGKGSAPKPVMPLFYVESDDKSDDGVIGFDSPEALKRRREEILRKFKKQGDKNGDR